MAMNNLLGMLFVVFLGLFVYFGMIGFVCPKIQEKLVIRERISKLRPRSLEALKEKQKDNFSLLNPLVRKLNGRNKRQRQRAKTAEQEKREKELASQLYSAGINMPVQTYQFFKNMISSVAFAVSFLVVMTVMRSADQTSRLCVLLVGLIGPMIVFRFGLSAKITAKKTEIEKQLPNVLDLLSIAVDAGMGFDQALMYVTQNMDGPLVDELIIVNREMGLGVSRKDAFSHLAERTAIESVKGFGSAVVQASEMGLPIKNVLESQAASVREARVAAIKTKAAKASIKMLLPMVGFIFPVIFIILMGPAVLNILDSGVF